MRYLQAVYMEQENKLSTRIASFYLGEQQDSEGRTIHEIWSWTFQELEDTHNYIQWLFPLDGRSAFYPSAPIVDEGVIQAFHNSNQLRQNLLRSFTLMLNFYGLKYHKDREGKVFVTQSDNYSERKREWMQLYDHNYLRISRILKCLTLLGLKDEAQAFYQCLQKIYHENSTSIERETFRYWTNAVRF